MCTLLLSTLQWCINDSWYLFVILQWPFHINSIYPVLRSWGLTCRFFFNASKILFYRLTYIVCQVFKRVYLPTSMKRHIDVSELLRFIKGHLDIFSCIIPVFKLSFNKLLQSKNYRKGVFLIDEWIDLFSWKGTPLHSKKERHHSNRSYK